MEAAPFCVLIFAFVAEFPAKMVLTGNLMLSTDVFPRQNGFDGLFLSIKPLSIWKAATFLLLFADHYLFLFVAQKFVQEGRSQYQHASRQLHG